MSAGGIETQSFVGADLLERVQGGVLARPIVRTRRIRGCGLNRRAPFYPPLVGAADLDPARVLKNYCATKVSIVPYDTDAQLNSRLVSLTKPLGTAPRRQRRR